MYPNHYFGLFPPFPRTNKVFVAMSFDPRLNDRWEKVLVPAIKSEKVAGVPLEPHRVDARRISDSILTEILDGISKDQLVIADVTAIGRIDKRPVRNGNVMYEVGIAHAIRLPEEVLLFRSDTEELLFDISNVRINQYAPEEDYTSARELVAGAIRDALKERDLKRHNAITTAAKTLDITSWAVLVNALASDSGYIQHFPMRNTTEAMANIPKNAAIRRLLEIGALEANFSEHSLGSIRDMKDDREMYSYKLTPFGHALIVYVNGKTIDIFGNMENGGTVGQQTE